MNKCIRPECNETKYRRRGKVFRNEKYFQRVTCVACGKDRYLPVSKENDDLVNKSFYMKSDKIREIKNAHDVFVISSIQNETVTHKAFKDTLLKYCEAKNARLMLIPIRYQNPDTFHSGKPNDVWDLELEKYFIQNTINIGDNVQILGDLKIVATARNPLSGLEALTVGKTTIVGHNQLEMKSCARLDAKHPVVLISTGTISQKNYSDSKTGYMAKGTHNNSAIVLEIDRVNDIFHFRHIETDASGCFYDIDGYWTPQGLAAVDVRVEALITGDEHATAQDPENFSAVYSSPDSIVARLKPKKVIRHDLLDSYSVNHHHEKKFFINVAKHETRKNDLQLELDETAAFIEYSSSFLPKDCMNYVVGSNHNDHLMKWLETPKAALDVVNAKIYTKLRSLVLEHQDDPFKLWLLLTCPLKAYVTFLGRNESFKVKGIELALHGDQGPNGARGSLAALSKIGTPCVIGHSHSPGIEKECFQVGTSTPIRLEYNAGLTGWMQTHCVIYPNGQRQLLNVIKGRWHK